MSRMAVWMPAWDDEETSVRQHRHRMAMARAQLRLKRPPEVTLHQISIVCNDSLQGGWMARRPAGRPTGIVLNGT